MTISIHAPHEGSDNRGIRGTPAAADFNPRSPRGERPSSKPSAVPAIPFQSTLPTRGATIYTAIVEAAEAISIHAPHEGSDSFGIQRHPRLRGISIHAPHEGSDLSLWRLLLLLASLFQSTLPTRGATLQQLQVQHRWWISIHAPHEGSDEFSHTVDRLDEISIHAPHEGSDRGTEGGKLMAKWISIHAPHEGSDGAERFVWPIAKQFQSTLPTRGATPRQSGMQMAISNFNPRSPRGERPVLYCFLLCQSKFQSTLPTRGATSLRQGSCP